MHANDQPCIRTNLKARFRRHLDSYHTKYVETPGQYKYKVKEIVKKERKKKTRLATQNM